MIRIAAVFMVAVALMGCDMIDTMVGGLAHTRAVERDLEAATGIKPTVGFKWSNGFLKEVTVTFPRLYEDKPLRELAEIMRGAVVKEFKQTPDELVLGFTVGAGGGRTARAGD